MPKKVEELTAGRLPFQSILYNVGFLACTLSAGLSCASGNPEAADASDHFDGSCAAVLQVKSPPATLPCPPGKEAACPYLTSVGKDLQVHFSFSYLYNAPKTHSGGLDGTANQHYQQCIIKYLADNGLAGFIDPYDQYVAQVSANGTYSQVVPVASRLAVYDIDCNDGATCLDCLPLTADQCAATPICHVFWGEPGDVAQGGIGAAQPLGCLSLSYDDSGSAEWVRNPQGN